MTPQVIFEKAWKRPVMVFELNGKLRNTSDQDMINRLQDDPRITLIGIYDQPESPEWIAEDLEFMGYV